MQISKLCVNLQIVNQPQQFDGAKLHKKAAFRLSVKYFKLNGEFGDAKGATASGFKYLILFYIHTK